MNILYISHLSTNIAAGLNWSVPAGVTAQKKYDNVFWIDINEVEMSHWLKSGVFHHASEFGGLRLKNFPRPFNNPDLVVFEGFYAPREALFAYQLRRKRIPYIIIPRGSLTHQAMHNHAALKKKVAHFLLFNSYVKHARAIQYLTEAEHKDAGDKWNDNHYILSNGFNYPEKYKQTFCKNGIKAIFIGRLDMYHKGLDELLKAIDKCKDVLRTNQFHLELYGPQKYDYYKIDAYIKEHSIEDIVELKGEISGINKEEAILKADLFVMPSRFEGHPMGLIEALAYGLPVMVTPGSNMTKEIESEQCGWVCSETNSQKLEIVLERICKEKDLLPQMSQKARSMAKKYDWDILAKKFHDIAQDLIK